MAIFDKCYVAEGKNGYYLAIRKSDSKARTYQGLSELGDFESKLAKTLEFKNIKGAQASGVQLFSAQIGGKNKDYEEIEVIKENGDAVNAFDIPFKDILEMKFV
jgi:hypothetical protein